MEKEYDFSEGERGKFFNPEAKLKLPIYFDEEIQELFIKIAEKKNVDINVLVNETIKANLDYYKQML